MSKIAQKKKKKKITKLMSRKTSHNLYSHVRFHLLSLHYGLQINDLQRTFRPRNIFTCVVPYEKFF